jgi:integrase
MTTAFTAITVASYRPAASRREIPDGGCRGLYLVIQPTGAKSWAVRYHLPGSTKTVKLTLGTVGVLSLADARLKASEIQHQRATGKDPQVKEPTTHTFASAARLYVEERASRRLRRWRPIAALLGLDPDSLLPRPGGLADRWQGRGVQTITGDDIHLALSWRQSRHLLSALSQMFQWLIDQRIVKVNPCVGVRGADPNPPRERVLSDDEIRWLWRACDAAGYPYGPLIKFLLITGARRQEAAAMTRSELTGSVWTLPKERAKNGRTHAVTLPALALEQLQGNHEFLFSGSGFKPAGNIHWNKQRLDALMAGVAPRGHVIPHFVIHDLRRTAITGMARAGVELHVIERAVNHVGGSFGGIVGVYQQYKYTDQVAAALEAWSQLLTEIVSPSNIVPMRA